MCALCGDPNLVHDGPGASPSAGQGQPGGSFAQLTPDIIETADAANGTGTTYIASVNQVIRGQLGSATDHDWYRVNLVAGQTYTFALVGTGTSDLPDPELFLRDGSANPITSNDDGGPGLSSTITYTATATGTYYLDAAAWNSSGSGQYGLSITQGNRAHYDVAMGGGAVDADASWSATTGTGATVTYGFRQSEPPYSVSGSATQGTFSQLTPQEIAAVQQSLQVWTDVANITFTQVNPGGYTDNATILFSNYNDPNDGAGAFAFYPGSTASTDPAGDVYLNTSSVSISSLPLGSYSAFATMHEIGHTLGLSHPGDYNAAPGQSITYANNAQFIEDSQQYSVMSYFDEANTGGNLGGYPDTPLLFDVYALQQIYGPNMTTRTGDTVYGFGSNAGAIYDFSINTTGLCIWDAGGIDTLDCSGFGQNQLIDLTAGLLSNIGGLTGNVSIALGATIENAVGGIGADTIIGNFANNTLAGGGNADIFNSGAGLDTLIGGAGADQFVFDNIAYTEAIAATPFVDHITDYDRGNNGTYSFAEDDQIQLSALLSGAYSHGGGLPVGALVRAVESPTGAGSLLQVDLDAAANGYSWTTIAQLDGVRQGDIVNVVLDGTLPAGSNILPLTNSGGMGDFNGDGTSDALWRHDDGTVAIWQMNNSAIQSPSFPAWMASSWHIVGIGDFNHDHTSDILWRDDNGTVLQWLMNSNAIQFSQVVESLAATTAIAGIDDFNHDGNSDILLRTFDSGGSTTITIQEMNGGTILASGVAGTMGSDWGLVGVGDFNSDGNSDILFRQQGTGTTVIWKINGTRQAVVFEPGVPTDWHVVGVGDFNNDHTSDILWRNDNGIAAIWLMDDGHLQTAGFFGVGTDWHVIGVGDLNGDSRDDILWRNDNSTTAISQMDGFTISATTFATGVPAVWEPTTHHYDFI